MEENSKDFECQHCEMIYQITYVIADDSSGKPMEPLGCPFCLESYE